jgi:hypothetical protein
MIADIKFLLSALLGVEIIKIDKRIGNPCLRFPKIKKEPLSDRRVRLS